MKLTIYNKFEAIPEREKVKNDIPIFATQQYENYLSEIKRYKTIWITGNNDSGEKYLIPFSVMRKGPFKKGVFLTAVISLGTKNTIEIEKEFLNEIVAYIKKNNLCDWIEQPPNWAIFNTYPDNAIFAPFGTYKINLESKTEEELFKNLYAKVRSRINKGIREKKIIIKKIEESLDDAISLIDNTLKSSKVDSFTKRKVDIINKHLSDKVLGYTAYFDNEPQSSLIYFYNSYSIYGLYAGSKRGAVQGATELLIWEAIKESKKRNIKYFDCVGARINPAKNSKLYRIQRNKAHLGTELHEGFLWKMVINQPKYYVYTIYVRIMNVLKGKNNKGDIIDQEIKRLAVK